jgi:hypothetical protein
MQYSVFSRQSAVLCGRNFEAFDQSGKHPLDLDNFFFKPSLNRDSQYSQVRARHRKYSTSHAEPIDICKNRLLSLLFKN